MTQVGRPEVFYKDDFCRAVCGYTAREMRDSISRGYVDPTEGIGRDMPRDAGEKFVDKFSNFMGTEFRMPLLDIPTEELYEAFRKFSAWERHVHPRDRFQNHEAYWGPTYCAIEDAYQRGDEEALRQGVTQLVDKILHD